MTDVGSTVSGAFSDVKAWYKNLSVYAAGAVGVSVGLVLSLFF